MRLNFGVRLRGPLHVPEQARELLWTREAGEFYYRILAAGDHRRGNSHRSRPLGRLAQVFAAIGIYCAAVTVPCI
jgi:hypothetical protein